MSNVYLGYGVYAERDTDIDQIWLSTERDGISHRVALTADELSNLNEFAARVWAPPPAPTEFDIEHVSHGSVSIVTGLTPSGDDWLAEHLQEGVQRWGVNGYVVEPRYVGDILGGAASDGLVVKT